MTAEYRLIPEPVPSKARSSIYLLILQEFAASKEGSVRVAIDRKPATVHLGLTKAKQTDPKFKGISVLRRKDTIYLKK